MRVLAFSHVHQETRPHTPGADYCLHHSEQTVVTLLSVHHVDISICYQPCKMHQISLVKQIRRPTHPNMHIGPTCRGGFSAMGNLGVELVVQKSWWLLLPWCVFARPLLQQQLGGEQNAKICPNVLKHIRVCTVFGEVMFALSLSHTCRTLVRCSSADASAGNWQNCTYIHTYTNNFSRFANCFVQREFVQAGNEVKWSRSPQTNPSTKSIVAG